MTAIDLEAGEEPSRVMLLEYLTRWGGLFVREGNRIVDAPEADIAVARSYPHFNDKGPILGGRRITVLTERLRHGTGEEVRVIHVVDYTEPGHQAYVMGPKTVFGEYVNDELMTPPVPEGDPLVPTAYNGRTLPSPAVDYNFEITSYTFQTPGTRRIQWRLGVVESNILAVTVEAPLAGV